MLNAIDHVCPQARSVQRVYLMMVIESSNDNVTIDILDVHLNRSSVSLHYPFTFVQNQCCLHRTRPHK